MDRADPERNSQRAVLRAGHVQPPGTVSARRLGMQTTTRIGLLLLLAWGSYGCAAGTAGVRDQGPSTGDSTGTGDNNGTGIGPGGTITTPPGGSGGDGTDQPGTCAEA